MNHKKRLNEGDRIVLAIENEGEYDAFCSPNCSGTVFVDGEEVGDVPDERESSAPFPIDIDFETYPTEGDVEALLPELENEFAEMFNRRVDNVYQLIEDADDPLDAIMEIDPDEI